MSRLINSPILAVLVLATTAVRPILAANLPCSDDVAFHLLRLVQLNHLMEQGVWFSRWAPDMAQGYGYPFFNFYAPLSTYTAVVFGWLTGDLHLAVRLTFAFGLFAAGLAMYRLARDHFSNVAAIVAAVAYVYAPYQGYDIYFRGNLAESFAWWLLPLGLWGMGRLARTGQVRWLGLTMAVYTAVILTHNVFALIFSPLLGLYGLFWLWQTREKNSAFSAPSAVNSLSKQRFALILAALGGGILLTTFFWLPALVERAYVHSDRLLVPPIFVYWGNFITLSELLALPRLVPTDLLNPSIPRALGLIHVLLALPSFLWLSTIWTKKPNSQFTIHNSQFTIFLWLSTAVFSFLMLPPSHLIWDTLPLLEYVQFPWRLLGVAALTLSLLIAASLDALSQLTNQPTNKQTNKQTTLILGLLFTTALILSTPYYFSPNLCAGLNDPTVADIARFEQATQTIGTTAKGEYVPRTVAEMPTEPYSQPFAPDPAWLAMGREPLRLWGELDNQTGMPLTVTANLFMYPGWTATVEGQIVDITPSVPHGLVQFPVPPGLHQVEVTFGETPLRWWANFVSAVSLLGLIGFVGWGHRLGWWYQPTNQLNNPSTNQAILPLYPFTLLGLLLFLLVHGAGLMQYEGRTWLEQQEGVPTAVYQGGLLLLDYELPETTLPADGQLLLTLWLGAERQTDANYQTLVHLVDENGTLWSDKEIRRPRIFRPYFDSRSWPLNEYAEDLLWIEAIPGTPPGLYTVQLVVFDAATLAPAALTDGRLAFDLGTVQVTPPENLRSANEAIKTLPLYELNAPFADANVRLFGYHPDRTEAAPGDPFLLTLYWQGVGEAREDNTAVLTLLAPDGQPAFTQEIPPVRADFPPSQWPTGDFIWRGQHGFYLPAHLESGSHLWQLELCQPNQRVCSPPLPLSALQINAPERLFEPPVGLDVVLDTAVGNLATLLGANLTSTDEDTLTLDLFWQVNQETNLNYRVFVHLLDENGQIIAQSDGEPAQWKRPTTGWLSGEIITDRHTLPPPLSTHTLTIGLYNPTTGERLGAVTISN